MNVWQVARQLKYLLQNSCTWDGTAKVFHQDSVKVLEQGQDEIALDENLVPPIAIFAPVTGQIDPVGRGELPSLIEREIDLTLMQLNQGDRVGEAALLGAQRYGANDSRGRGLMELEVPVFSAIKRLTAINGITIAFVGFGASAVRRAGEAWIAIQDYQLRAYCTTEKYYAPPGPLTASPSTGQIALSWRNPPDRYDRYRVRLVRKSGSTPPTSVLDGTIINMGSDLPTSYINTGLTPGTYSYALFASYSEFDIDDQDDNYSSPSTVSGVISF